MEHGKGRFQEGSGLVSLEDGMQAAVLKAMASAEIQMMFERLVDACVKEKTSEVAKSVLIGSTATEALVDSPKGGVLGDSNRHISTGSMRTDLRLGIDIIGRFDPEEPGASASVWLARADQLAEIHGWTEDERVLLMQSNLAGEAKLWFNRLQTISVGDNGRRHWWLPSRVISPGLWRSWFSAGRKRGKPFSGTTLRNWRYVSR